MQYDWKSFTLTRKEQLLNLRIRTLQRTNIARISQSLYIVVIREIVCYNVSQVLELRDKL